MSATLAHPTAPEKQPARMKVLRAMADWVDTEQYQPSVRDLGERVGLASPASVQAHLDRLRAEGFVDRADGKHKTLHITGKGWEWVLSDRRRREHAG